MHATPSCLSQASVLAYVTGRASEATQREVEEHVAACSDCLRRVQAAELLRDDFDALWGRWSVSEMDRMCRLVRLGEALEEVAQSAPTLAERAQRWRARLGESADMALRVLTDSARKLALAAAGSLPAGHAFRLHPVLAGVGAPEQLAQMEQHRTTGSGLLSRGQTGEALQELAAAGRIDPRAPQAAFSEVDRGGWLVVQASVDGRSGRAWVRYYPREGERAPALAVLVPDDPGAEPQAAAFDPVAGEAFLVAEFERLPEGAASVIIEQPD